MGVSALRLDARVQYFSKAISPAGVVGNMETRIAAFVSSRETAEMNCVIGSVGGCSWGQMTPGTKVAEGIEAREPVIMSFRIRCGALRAAIETNLPC